MTFAEGWVCRSCWKPNRAQDSRCYRCKTARDADDATVELQRRERVEKASREERVPAAVSALPATVFAWYGRLVILGGVLFLLLTPLVLGNPEAPENTLIIWLGLAVGTLLVGFAMRWASGAMRASNPWGFVVALVVSIGAIGGTLIALSSLQGLGNPNWMRYATIAVFGLSGISALVGLLFSLTGDSPSGPTADRT